MPLNHPETIPTPSWSVDKLSFMKLVPGAQKVGDCCSKCSARRQAGKSNGSSLVGYGSSLQRPWVEGPTHFADEDLRLSGVRYLVHCHLVIRR